MVLVLVQLNSHRCRGDTQTRRENSWSSAKRNLGQLNQRHLVPASRAYARHGGYHLGGNGAEGRNTLAPTKEVYVLREGLLRDRGHNGNMFGRGGGVRNRRDGSSESEGVLESKHLS